MAMEGWIAAAAAMVALAAGAGGAVRRPAVARLALDADRVAPGGALQAVWTFRSEGPLPEDLVVFVHVVRPDGRHIGADFRPALEGSRWSEGGFVREGPFPINVPADAAPGEYDVLVGLVSATLGERIALDNPDRVRGDREYLAGGFRVEAAGATGSAKPVVFELAPVTEPAVAAEQLARPATLRRGEKPLRGIELTLDRSTLNPVLQPRAAARVTLTAVYADGSRGRLRAGDAVVRARTRSASGGVAVAAVEGDRVRPLAGGIAEIEATVERGGRRFRAAAELVVRPFYRDYHQTLVLKLFMGMEGQPVERIARDPLFQKPHDVLCTFAEALEVIRRTDNLTCGIPKIVYLVGWQKGGHDHGYPSWDEVNPRLKRAQDATALESLRWLIRAARRYHTTVSLHINMVDAYRQSPLFDEYVARDLFARELDGRLLEAGYQMQGEPMYNVVYPREWAAGLAQRRIDRLIAMIPELKAGHTIHIDVFIAQRAAYGRYKDGDAISPWHALPEHGSLTPARYVETQRLIFRYWRDRGFDVTGEGIFWAHPPGEGFTGLQAMTWWYPGDPGYQMATPERLMARGRTDRGGDGDFRFGSSMHGEEIYQRDREKMPGFLGMFCRTTLPWRYLSRLDRLRLEGDALIYSGGVVARVEGGRRVIRQGDFVLRDEDDLFVPALWNGREIIAYSRTGYAERAWRLPADWGDVAAVDLYRITPEGYAPGLKGAPAVGGDVTLSLAPGEAVRIVPAGAAWPGRR